MARTETALGGWSAHPPGAAGDRRYFDLAEALGLIEIVLGDGDRGEQLDLRLRRLGAVLRKATSWSHGRSSSAGRGTARSWRSGSPSLTWARASGRASKPISAILPARLRAFTASIAPRAMSSLAATITSGGVGHAGERRFGHGQALLAVEARRSARTRSCTCRHAGRGCCAGPCCGRWPGRRRAGPAG